MSQTQTPVKHYFALASASFNSSMFTPALGFMPFPAGHGERPCHVRSDGNHEFPVSDDVPVQHAPNTVASDPGVTLKQLFTPPPDEYAPFEPGSATLFVKLMFGVPVGGAATFSTPCAFVPTGLLAYVSQLSLDSETWSIVTSCSVLGGGFVVLYPAPIPTGYDPQ
jgi:hypothetical protein